MDSTIISMATGTLVPDGEALTISQGRFSELGRWSGDIGCKRCLGGPIDQKLSATNLLPDQ
jgi:hypothetical protein